jgi:Domain of unknown function (DUF6980)
MRGHVQAIGDDPVPVIDPCRPVLYDAVFDEYRLTCGSALLDAVVLDFCPWCGVDLPDSRRDEWFDTLAAAGVEPDDPALDERFHSDAWWTGPGGPPAPSPDRRSP